MLSYMGWFLPTNTYKAYKMYIESNVKRRVLVKLVSLHDKKENKLTKIGGAIRKENKPK